MSANTLGLKALEDAAQYVGVVKETSPNWSIHIKVYLAFCGIFKPAAWCAAFLAYRVHMAAKVLGVKTMWPKKAYVQDVVNWATKNGHILHHPEPGCAVALYFPELKRYAHIGLVETLLPNRRIQIIEGNTNADGGREGNVVARRKRFVTDSMLFIRIV